VSNIDVSCIPSVLDLMFQARSYYRGLAGKVAKFLKDFQTQ